MGVACVGLERHDALADELGRAGTADLGEVDDLAVGELADLGRDGRVVQVAHAAGHDDLGVEIPVGDPAELEELGALGGDVVDREGAGAAEVLVDRGASRRSEGDFHVVLLSCGVATAGWFGASRFAIASITAVAPRYPTVTSRDAPNTSKRGKPVSKSGTPSTAAVRRPWLPDDEQVDVGRHAREVADDDLLGEDPAGDGRGRGDDGADGPSGHLVEDRGDAGSVVGFECERDALAAHAQVRIAHRVDEDAAVALETRRRRRTRDERERGEQRVGARETGGRVDHGVGRLEPFSQVARCGLERGAENDRCDSSRAAHAAGSV